MTPEHFHNLPESPPHKRKLIVSLVGPSGSGKSTLAQSTAEILFAKHGLKTAIVQKDTALRDLSREKFGADNDSTGYTPRIYFGKGRYTTRTIHERINADIQTQLTNGADVVILEGGTRTRRAMAITLKDIDADNLILKMLVHPGKIIANLRRRRKETKRSDDHLGIMLGKLFRQYTVPLMHRTPEEEHVKKVDANKSAERVAAQTVRIIEKKLNLH